MSMAIFNGYVNLPEGTLYIQFIWDILIYGFVRYDRVPLNPLVNHHFPCWKCHFVGYTWIQTIFRQTHLWYIMIYYNIIRYITIYRGYIMIYHHSNIENLTESGWIFLRVELRIGRCTWLNQQWYSALGLSQKKCWANTGKTNKSSRFKLHLPHQYGNFRDILRFETSPYLDVNCRTERCSKPSTLRDFTNEDVRPKWASLIRGQTLPDFMIFSWNIMKYQWDFCRIFIPPVDITSQRRRLCDEATINVVFYRTWLAGAIGPAIGPSPSSVGDLPEKSEMDDSEFDQKIHHQIWPGCIICIAGRPWWTKLQGPQSYLAWTVGLIMGIQHDTTIV